MAKVKLNTNLSGGSSSGGGATGSAIVTQLAVGASGANETIPAGTTLEDYIRLTRTTTFEPTSQNPSLGRSISGSNNREVGELLSETITLNFNRGNILGKLVNGIWNAGIAQNPRAGLATSYSIDNSANGISNSRAVSRVIELGSNTFNCSVSYADGPQPTNSAGANSTTLSIYPAGTISNNLTVNGFYRRFWGSVSAASSGSNDIRNLSNSALDNSGVSFTLATGSTNSVFEIAIPATRSLVSVIDVDALNLNVTANYVLTTITTVKDAAGVDRSYKVYRMTNAGPYSSNHNHNITIA